MATHVDPATHSKTPMQNTCMCRAGHAIVDTQTHLTQRHTQGHMNVPDMHPVQVYTNTNTRTQITSCSQMKTDPHIIRSPPRTYRTQTDAHEMPSQTHRGTGVHTCSENTQTQRHTDAHRPSDADTHPRETGIHRHNHLFKTYLWPPYCVPGPPDAGDTAVCKTDKDKTSGGK